jgi:hypothetical protein
MAALGGKVFLFGGFDDNTAYSDTWQWDGTTWKQLNVVGPPGRYNMRMVAY